MKLLEKQPEDRYESAEALLKALWDANKERSTQAWKVRLGLPPEGPAPVTQEEVEELHQPGTGNDRGTYRPGPIVSKVAHHQGFGLQAWGRPLAARVDRSACPSLALTWRAPSNDAGSARRKPSLTNICRLPMSSAMSASSWAAACCLAPASTGSTS
jgi:hypothetical protein